jgi:hypothetical protein
VFVIRVGTLVTRARHCVRILGELTSAVRFYFGPALSIGSHPATTEPPDIISAPTEEKTTCVTNKNRREPRIAQRVLSFNNKLSPNYYTNSYQYFRNYFMIEIMTE